MSALARKDREAAIGACARLTSRIDRGLDLSGEIRTVLKQGTGDVPLIYRRSVLDGFAVCMNGPGSEGGSKTCYVKFGAARAGDGAGERFGRLLRAVDDLAIARGVSIEAGVNLACEYAFRLLRSHGYKTVTQGVAMQRPNVLGFNRPDAYVMNDWR